MIGASTAAYTLPFRGGVAETLRPLAGQGVEPEEVPDFSRSPNASSTTLVGQYSTPDTSGSVGLDEERRLRVSAGSLRISGMQKWEGRILEIDNDTFSAELIPIDDRGPRLVAEFSRKNLGPDDAPNARVGDIVYVTVRTVRAKGMGPAQTSAVRLRRLGQWTSGEVDRIEKLTKQRMASLADLVD